MAKCSFTDLCRYKSRKTFADQKKKHEVHLLLGMMALTDRTDAPSYIVCGLYNYGFTRFIPTQISER